MPSHEVLAKIQCAYGLSDSSFTPFVKKTATQITLKKRYIFAFLLGFFVLVSGFLELFFHQTYYTYKAELKSTSDVVSFYVTDQYQGESYNDVFARVSNEYVLIGERNIPRIENNWLKAIGLLLMLFSIFGVIRDKLFNSLKPQ